MGRAKVTPEKNDGGMVVVLVLLMGALSYAAISAVHFYVTATATRDRARLPRLLSGWANIGNCFFHILVVCQLLTDTENLSKFFDDAEQPTAAIVLAVLNGAIGLIVVNGGRVRPWLAIGWNGFIAAAGSLIPDVWPKFIQVGLTTWPLLTIFLWLGIFVCEATGFFSSCVWAALH